MLPPPNLQSNFGGCGISFGVRHAIICCKVGLLIERNNEVRDEILYLAQ